MNNTKVILIKFRINFVCWTQSSRHSKERRSWKKKDIITQVKSKRKKCYFGSTKIVEVKKTDVRKDFVSERERNAEKWMGKR